VKLLRNILLALLVLTISGCAASKATISEQVPSGSEIYVVDIENDKLGISSDIYSFLQSEGLSPQLVQPEDIKIEKSGDVSVAGSGFFISSDGHIITNHHVVEGYGEEFSIRTAEGKSLEAKLVFAIPNSDVAILKSDHSDNLFVNLSSKMSGMTGSKILVVGYPLSQTLGNQARVSDGLVNADVGIQDDPTFIQISAPIQPGNSGGPIVDENFDAIGIATASMSTLFALKSYGELPQNVNFGVKVATVLPFLTFDLPHEQKFKAKSLKEVISATVLIKPMPGRKKITTGKRKVGVFLQYTYRWDVIVWQLNSMVITLKDIENGSVLGKVVHSGDHPSGKSAAVEIAMKELRKLFQ
jgi:hypothetical protein